MAGPYTSFNCGPASVEAADVIIADTGIVLVGPAQGTRPASVPATGQLFPTGQAPQQGA